MFSTYNLSHLPSIASDHSPLLVSASKSRAFKPKIFRIENYWLEYFDCISIVRNSLLNTLHSSPMHAFAHLHVRIRSNLFSWKSGGLGALDLAIKNIGCQIKDFEMFEDLGHHSDLNSIEHKSLSNKYKALLRQNTRRWVQRARLNWVHAGDLNTSFFHRCASIHRNFNFISHISDDNGNTFMDRSNIEDTFLHFCITFIVKPVLIHLSISWKPFLMILRLSLALTQTFLLER